jgi:chorismate mutase / prephenate dehydratase
LEDVVGCVESRRADFCVIPLENSTEGSVSRTLDLLLQTDLLISAEVSLPIDHLLLTRANSLAEVTEVCAHPQALAQCRRWLLANLPNVQQIAVSSNAEGALKAQKHGNVAAIAGLAAQACYGLTALAKHIQDDSHNKTRFLVLGRLKSGISQVDRTSFILSVPNQPGAVYRMLEPLSKHGVSMSRFESRPARTGRWEYYFYIDVLGHQDEPALKAAISELQACTSFFKCLGSYPAVD